MSPEAKRVAIALAGLAALGALALVVWPRDSGGRAGVEGGDGVIDAPSSAGGAGGSTPAGGDGGVAAELGDPRRARAGDEGDEDDDHGQDRSTEGRTDGAVPYVATPPYQPPTEDLVVLTPAELNRRRLEQVGLIEERIEALDREIEGTVDSMHRTSLMARREHLEARRAELLAEVASGR